MKINQYLKTKFGQAKVLDYEVKDIQAVDAFSTGDYKITFQLENIEYQTKLGSILNLNEDIVISTKSCLWFPANKVPVREVERGRILIEEILNKTSKAKQILVKEIAYKLDKDFMKQYLK